MMKRFPQDHGAKGIALSSFFTLSREFSWHFLMMTFISLLMFCSLAILNGCSGGGGGGTTPAVVDDTPDDTPEDTGYTGSAKVSGTIKLSYLSSSDSALVDADAAMGRATSIHAKTSKAVSAETEAVKLYVMGANGELVDTGIACTIEDDGNGDRAYDCDGVKDDVNYIVRYVMLNAATGKALEMKSQAYVPSGATAPTTTTDVTPRTSVVVKALVDAILSATAGSDIDDAVINSIIQSVKTAIETLVTSGAIQIPSMVVDVGDDTTLADLVGDDTENENLDNTAGLVLADDTVGGELGYISAVTQATKFDLSTVDTPAEKEALIRKVFKDLLTNDKGEADDMPTFFYNFFIWHYVNNMTVTPDQLLQALINSMTYDDSVTPETKAEVTVANALTMFNTFIARVHVLTAKDPLTLNTSEKAELAEIPGVVRGLFPVSFGSATTSTNLITPQGIAMVIFFDEVFMAETVVPASATVDGTTDDSGQITYDNHNLYEWDDEALFTTLGLATYVSTHSSEFNGIEIFGLYLHPGSVWIEGSGDTPGEEREALMLGTDLMNLSSFVNDAIDMDITDQSGATVTLTYPKASGGTGTVDLVYVTYQDGQGNWGVNPWEEARIGMAPDSTEPVIIDPTRVISDFTSGTYTINVTLGNVTATKSFTKTVITGMMNKYVKMVSPAGMPIWPGNNASQDEWDAYNAAWSAFERNGGRTNFTANVTDLGTVPGVDETATKAKITLSWQAPVVTLPEGVKMVYDLDIGQGSCDDTGCSWTQIWNTWDSGKRIYTTSFTIPRLFDIQDAQDALSNPYHLNIRVNFVNQATGEQLGSGGNAHTEFSVGTPIDLANTFTIEGAITINDDTITPSHLRAALVKETQVDNTFTRRIVRIADITGETSYRLEFEIGDFLSTDSVNSWYNLVLIPDEYDSLSDGDLLGINEVTFWPDYTSGGMWFDTWGGILRVKKDTCNAAGDCFYEEKIITGSEAVIGPKFYIGQGFYVAPDPTQLEPVPANVLTQTFTIQGDVDVTNVDRPVVLLMEEGYSSTSGFYIQTVLRIATIDQGQYSLTAEVGDFYKADGTPTDTHFQIVLVNDADPADTSMNAVAMGEPLDYLETWWPDWSTGTSGFDTWRGTELHYYKETYDDQNTSWSYDEWAIPSQTTTITGPSLSAGQIP
ncbi:MAG: hypothetical protein KKD44_22700 [Proteobacteria bacterium]|nr:hypothetical protein [Pseudomonadota bacterium]